jgi:hypothetical protein
VAYSYPVASIFLLMSVKGPIKFGTKIVVYIF